MMIQAKRKYTFNFFFKEGYSLSSENSFTDKLKSFSDIVDLSSVYKQNLGIEYTLKVELNPTGRKSIRRFMKFLDRELPIQQKEDPTTSIFKSLEDVLESKIETLDSTEHNLDKLELSNFTEEQKIKIISDTSFLIEKIYSDHNLLNIIDPFKFEEIIAELLKNKGYEVHLTQKTRDNGYDILALQTLNGGFPIKLLVECKRYNKAVGINLIRSFCNVINHENANKGIMFTTSYFSKDAHKRQLEYGAILDLRDRNTIIDWINDYKRFKK